MINDNLMLVFKATENNDLQFDGSWWVHQLSRAFYALPEFKEKFSIYHGFTLTDNTPIENKNFALSDSKTLSSKFSLERTSFLD